MPDVQEVFRMATQKVRPDPGALERQFRRQRRRTVGQKVAVYALVVAFVLAAIVIAVTRMPGNGSKPASRSTAPAGINLQHVVVAGLDGSVKGDVPGVPAGGWGLSLSADGTRIAFTESNYQISTIGSDGTNLRQFSLAFQAQTPVWSPDGSRIAFEGTRLDNTDIYVMDADGSNLRRLTTSPAADQWPSWSPNGTRIVYDNLGAERADDSGFSPTSEIYSISTSGGTPTRLTHNGVDDSQAAYSPDGAKIAFHRGGGMWIMDANGSNKREVSLPGRCCTGFTPQWSPDGTKIAFTRYDPTWRYSELAVVRVYVLDLASGKVTAVGHFEMSTDSNPPQWLPSGDALLINRVERP